MASENEGMLSGSVEVLPESDSCRWFDFTGMCQWKRTSSDHLVKAENKMLQFVGTSVKKAYMKLNDGNKLWTLSLNTNKSKKTPLVMVHGFAGGIGLWSKNVDALSQKRPLYAFDLLGFGRSSRPKFDKIPEQAENMFVESIEQWRQAAKLDKMILLGHSFGGYLVSSYALKYPERIKSLILVDPWGFPPRDPNAERRFPLWIRALVHVLSSFNPLSTVRAAGPFGLGLVKKFRADFKHRYPEVSEKDENAVFEYIYHCNAGSPTGEAAFKRMTEYFAYSYKPMLSRIGNLREDVPVTFVYGKDSWMDNACGKETQNLLPNNPVEIYTVNGAGHHVYADQAEAFNSIVNTVCDDVD